MIIGLQIVGLLFAIVMFYFTFLYYKRGDYDIRGFFFWTLVWIGFAVLAIFPSSVYGVMQTLQINRTVDFLVIGGFLFMTVVIFHLYSTVKKNQKKLESLVRKIAIKRAK